MIYLAYKQDIMIVFLKLLKKVIYYCKKYGTNIKKPQFLRGNYSANDQWRTYLRHSP